MKNLIETTLPEQPQLRKHDIDLEQVSWEQVTEFLCTCFYRKRIRSPLPDVPPDDVWVKLIDQQNWGPLSRHPQQDKAIKETVPVPLFPLEQKLLAVGGARMVYRYEPDLKRLLKSAVVFNEPVESIPGEAHNCHSNVARLWRENRDGLAIATGYALSADGLWRQHSWLIFFDMSGGESKILETTIKREKYFGIILTSREAEVFSQMNQ
ncbi:MAG: hypothetical protein JO031_00680 [Ktedonobacteraceae bacterium]|nr:hypothetical protein [Ktedonobacteraceae bacterium]